MQNTADVQGSEWLNTNGHKPDTRTPSLRLQQLVLAECASRQTGHQGWGTHQAVSQSSPAGTGALLLQSLPQLCGNWFYMLKIRYKSKSASTGVLQYVGFDHWLVMAKAEADLPSLRQR